MRVMLFPNNQIILFVANILLLATAVSVNEAE